MNMQDFREIVAEGLTAEKLDHGPIPGDMEAQDVAHSGYPNALYWSARVRMLATNLASLIPDDTKWFALIESIPSDLTKQDLTIWFKRQIDKRGALVRESVREMERVPAWAA